MIDATNFSSAAWTSYNPAPYVDLGSREGWHQVWIGLRGESANASEYWQGTRFKLDTSPPRIVITNPPHTVSQTLVQLTGYSPESLTHISCDISNAAGTWKDQQVLVLDQHFEPGTWEFTTNTFQMFDVSLVSGTNLFTFHATDMAGNIGSTNYTIVVLPGTNAPHLKVIWPSNGSKIPANVFTIFGQMDDPSAHINAVLVDDAGNTNSADALIERDGKFWVEDMPLANGMTRIALTAVNSWGGLATTNFSVRHDSLLLAFDPIDSSKLYRGKMDLTGIVGNPNYNIWINGVRGTNHGDGRWSASDVPITSGGTARFYLAAYPPGHKLLTNPDDPTLNPIDPADPETSLNIIQSGVRVTR